MTLWQNCLVKKTTRSMLSLPKGLEVTLCPTDVSEYTSQVYAGLFDLRERGEIRVRIKPLRRRGLRTCDSVYLECAGAGLRQRRRVFIDLIDGSALYAGALDEVDVYVKRSLRTPPFIDAGGTRVIPYGLQFAANMPAVTSRIRAALHWRASFRGGVAYSPTRRLRAAGEAAMRWVRRGSVIGKSSPRPLASIELRRHINKAPQVFFATRVYSPEEAPLTPEREQINERRVELVRGLRRSFGARFVGGLRFSTFAQKHYGDCVYRVPDNQAWHYRTGQQSLVHVNSTGLHGSTGWKLAEALAQQSCLVSEPCLDELPQPLRDGVHCLTFSRLEECVSHCDTLLRDSSLAEWIRQEGHRYYLNGVRPDALVRNLLLGCMPHAH
jgi:hypothetical protein